MKHVTDQEWLESALKVARELAEPNKPQQAYLRHRESEAFRWLRTHAVTIVVIHGAEIPFHLRPECLLEDIENARAKEQG